jgi:hypothetical protein
MSSTKFKIIFPDGFNQRHQHEMTLRGCLSDALVELANGEQYDVDFIEPSRLAHDLAGYVAANIPCYAEPGLIVIQEITMDSIHEALHYLCDHDFFKSFKPVNVEPKS